MTWGRTAFREGPSGEVRGHRLPDDLDGLAWRPATVPGTAAGALRATGEPVGDLDGEDWWFRTSFEADRAGHDEQVVLCFGGIATLAEVFLNGQRVGDVELAPGFTQYAKRVPYQAYDVAALLRPGRNVLAVLVADGWYRGQVGAPRPADQFGTDVAVRVQIDELKGRVGDAAGVMRVRDGEVAQAPVRRGPWAWSWFCSCAWA